jgi:DNA-binding CsgD family transcriptional regulator
MLSPDLQVRAQTQETEEHLRRLLPTDADRQPIPAAAYNVAAQLLAVEAGVDNHPATARVHLADGHWVTVRAARIGDTDATDADIAVTIEPTRPLERMSLFVRAFGLSDREAELVRHLADGADTHRIASAMFISEHTVQDHLKSIFAKTDTSNRRTLLAILRGGS